MGGGGRVLPGSREAGQGGGNYPGAAEGGADPCNVVSPWGCHPGESRLQAQVAGLIPLGLWHLCAES